MSCRTRLDCSFDLCTGSSSEARVTHWTHRDKLRHSTKYQRTVPISAKKEATRVSSGDKNYTKEASKWLQKTLNFRNDVVLPGSIYGTDFHLTNFPRGPLYILFYVFWRQMSPHLQGLRINWSRYQHESRWRQKSGRLSTDHTELYPITQTSLYIRGNVRKEPCSMPVTRPMHSTMSLRSCV